MKFLLYLLICAMAVSCTSEEIVAFEGEDNTSSHSKDLILQTPTEPEVEVNDAVSKNPEPRVNTVPGAAEIDDTIITPLMDQLCSYEEDNIKSNNCLKILEAAAQGELPKGPTLYALKALKMLHHKICDSKVIKNDCSVMISDLDHSFEKDGNTYNYRHPSYFLNLCFGDDTRTDIDHLFYKSFTHRGTGSKKDRVHPNYTDKPGIKTTITGLFVTSDLTAFHPYIKSRPHYVSLGYKLNDSRCKGRGSSENNWLGECPVLRLALHRIGGSRSVDSKPMHTSPFKSSSGCPSVMKGDNWIMRKMAEAGPSLYIAYTRLEKYRDEYNLENRCE